jgi:hypothetical protein
MIAPFCLFGSFNMGAPVVDREAGVENSGPVCWAKAGMAAAAKNAIARRTLAPLPTLNDI